MTLERQKNKRYTRFLLLVCVSLLVNITVKAYMINAVYLAENSRPMKTGLACLPCFMNSLLSFSLIF